MLRSPVTTFTFLTNKFQIKLSKATYGNMNPEDFFAHVNFTILSVTVKFLFTSGLFG